VIPVDDDGQILLANRNCSTQKRTGFFYASVQRTGTITPQADYGDGIMQVQVL
jgi:hypothetical protein